MGALLPTIVCGLGWGDWSGGYFWAGLARLMFVHHSTFCVNSLAHWAGEQTFSDGHTARNSIITAVLTLGEGYHNFHHEFPNDYRNGIEWYQYDPTKWLIYGLSVLGLVEELVEFPKDAIEKCRVETMARAAHAKAAELDWGDAPADLPEWTMARMKQECKENDRSLMVIGGFAVDATGFEDQHPGGADFILGYKGRDATRAFAGDVHRHNDAAQQLMRLRRVARVPDAPSAGWKIPASAKGQAKVEELPEEVAAVRRAAAGEQESKKEH